jgi:hypothetical protein
MARSTGQYFSGTLPTVGSGQRNNFFSQLKFEIEAFQSAGVDAWEEFDVLDAAPVPRNEIWRSLGDRNLVAGAGDANLFFQLELRLDNFFYMNAWQDWETAVGTGIRGAQTVSGLSFTLDDTGQLDYFGVRNEYEFSLAFVQSGTRYLLGFGSPIRNHIAPATRGIARATGNVVAGGPVVIPLDRDISSLIKVGQFVWVYDIVTPGSPFPGGHDNAEIAVVTAVTATNITVLSLVNNHGTATSKAIIGLDPCPMYMFFAQATSNPAAIYLTNRLDASYGGAGLNTGTIIPQTAGVTEAENDPASTNQHVGVTGAMVPAAGPGGFRGNFQHMHWWPVSTQADEDRMIPNFDVSLAEKIFPSLLNAGFAVALGPGAT